MSGLAPSGSGTGLQEPRLLLDVQSISKTFPGQVALQEARFALRPGEVHALVGQNGSGKSTLIKLLSGYIKADRGARVDLFGRPADLWHRDERSSRIRVVHQDLGLVGPLSTVENLGLGHGYATGVGGRIKWRQENARAQELLSDFGVTPDVRAPVASLSAAEQAAVAIVRALRGLDDEGILVLDEPTASLNRGEVDALFRAVRRAAGRGVGVIFVSHLLEEVLDLSDRVTVLRDGWVTAAGVDAASLDEEALIRHIIGNAVSLGARPEPAARGAHRLEVESLVGSTLRGVSLKVRAGEVVGVAGLIGSGRDELPGAIFGATPRFLGKVLVDKNKVFADPHESVAAAMAYVPADRKAAGMIPRHRVHEHLTLPQLGGLQRWGKLLHRKSHREARQWADRVDLQPLDVHRRMEKFSGGNQQKAVLARWLRTKPKVLLLSEPTQGVDVGAKPIIYDLIDGAAAEGLAVVVASSDPSELVRLSDRVLVMRGGQVVAELSGRQLTESRVIAETLGRTSLRRRQHRRDHPVRFPVIGSGGGQPGHDAR
ncbi:MAG: sugar ABC transporter ATP-binding protein [bacterium]|nr:sugar ABC transporter ATP-binding protein [bacterium]